MLPKHLFHLGNRAEAVLVFQPATWFFVFVTLKQKLKVNSFSTKNQRVGSPSPSLLRKRILKISYPNKRVKRSSLSTGQFDINGFRNFKFLVQPGTDTKLIRIVTDLHKSGTSQNPRHILITTGL